MELQNPIEESRRYVQNAKDILGTKAEKEDFRYNDSKYVKLAGHALWTGCLIALDYALQIKKRTRKSIDDYRIAAGKRDKKMLKSINDGYNIMHLYMGYDGANPVSISSTGIQIAEGIISWCENNTDKKEIN